MLLAQCSARTKRLKLKFLGIGCYVTCLFFLGITYREIQTVDRQNVDRLNLHVREIDRQTENQVLSRQFLDIPLNGSELDLVRQLLQGPASITDKLIRVGKILEQKLYPPLIPPSKHVGFDPEKGDVVLPGGIYHDLDMKYKWQRRKVPNFVELNAHARESIQRIIARYSQIQRRNAEAHDKPQPLNVYPKKNGKKFEPWERWHNSITRYKLYQDGDTVVEEMMRDLHEQPITKVEMQSGGTTLKLQFTMQNGARAIFKPKRFGREVEALPDHVNLSDHERYYAEIAAFHLDRILRFNRVPPTTGRWLNLTEIYQLADHTLEKTFFQSPARHICFYGECEYYCNIRHAVCGNPYMLEGSMMSYLPSRDIIDRDSFDHPWAREYTHHKLDVAWYGNDSYCDGVRTQEPYNKGRILTDLMDMAAFDFLQGNLDRHSSQTFEIYGNDTFPLHYDNGVGFGRSMEDDLSILAPVTQCCMFRYSTLETLFGFTQGSSRKLSDLMRDSLRDDPVAPVLAERHLRALDRRVNIILNTLQNCIDKNGADKVIIVDGF